MFMCLYVCMHINTLILSKNKFIFSLKLIHKSANSPLGVPKLKLTLT